MEKYWENNLLDYKKQGNYTKISIEDIEEFFILTDDIVRIIRYHKAFYDDESRQPNHYFLTWAADGCHDENVWVGIASTKEELERLYKKIKEEDGADYEEEGFKLEAYKYTGEEYEFVPVNNIM